MKETLQITIRKNRRSEDLVQITRKTEKEKISHSYSQSNEAIPEANLFDDAELFEIEWFDQMVKFFLEHTNSNVTELERYRLFLPEKLYKAMYDLSLTCKKHGVDYRPMDSILKSIVNKIKVTEKKIYEKTGIEYDVLSKIDYKEPASDTDQVIQDAIKVFKSLVEQPDFYNEFNKIAAQNYKKNHNIKLGHFKGYAQGHNMPSKWVFSCAVDVIAKSVNPLLLIDEEILYDVWVKPSLRAGKNSHEIIDQLNKWGASKELMNKA